MIVTVANLKGGVAKTTTAMFLAEAAHRTGDNPVVLDADPQLQSFRWAELSDLAFPVDRCPSRAVRPTIDTTAGEYGVVFVDTPPGETDTDIVMAAMAAADVVVVPIAPSASDVDRLTVTLHKAETLGVPAVVLLTQTDERWRAHKSLVTALEQDPDIAVMRSSIPRTVRISEAWGSAIEDLYRYDDAWQELRAALEVIAK